MKENNYTLLIMAAGMGTRFGGLKQIEPVGPCNEFIIDYSVFDAIKAGFNKVVFVIKKENFEIFKDTIGKRFEHKIKVEYAFQELNDIPNQFEVPIDRTKPWGTGHAILIAKDYIEEPFAVINADDFYGYDAYEKLFDFLKSPNSINKKSYAVIGYKVLETLSENGSVKRGICETKNNKLVNLTESIIEHKNNTLVATPLGEEEVFNVNPETLVSMNMFGFDPTIFTFLEKEFTKFLSININNTSAEFLIPQILSKGIKSGFFNVDVIETTSRWYGITYKEDLATIKRVIKEKIENREY